MTSKIAWGCLKILENPNHHKKMRRESTMNIFAFENDGTNPQWFLNWYFFINNWLLKMIFSRNQPLLIYSKLDSTGFIRSATFCKSEIWRRGKSHAVSNEKFWKRILLYIYEISFIEWVSKLFNNKEFHKFFLFEFSVEFIFSIAETEFWNRQKPFILYLLFGFSAFI